MYVKNERLRGGRVQLDDRGGVVNDRYRRRRCRRARVHCHSVVVGSTGPGQSGGLSGVYFTITPPPPTESRAFFFSTLHHYFCVSLNNNTTTDDDDDICILFALCERCTPPPPPLDHGIRAYTTAVINESGGGGGLTDSRLRAVRTPLFAM